LPAGCSLSSSGLITGTTVDGVYQFTVIVSDAQLQSFQQQITLTISSTDPNFKLSTLAINADVNTFVRDATSNNFAVTITGDTRPSAFSPYNTNWSNYFNNSTGLALNYGTATHSFWNGNFTIEFWVNCPTEAWGVILSSWFNSNFDDGSWGLAIKNGVVGFSNRQSSATNQGEFVTAGSTRVDDGNWHHVVITQVTGANKTFRVFIDGILRGYDTETNWTQGSASSLIYIGTQGPGTFDEGGRHYTGYLSSLRLVSSVILEYSTSSTTLGNKIFTPPTENLSVVANTILLTCQSNRFIDNSTNNFTLTRNGDVKVTTFGPFTETDTTTGSGYLDGTGDYITVANNAAFNLPGDFTIEFWVNNNSVGANPSYICIGNTAATNNGFLIYYSSATTSLRVYSNGAALIVGPTLANSIWYHIAVVRSGSGSNNLTLYVNGVSAGQATNTATFTGVAGNGVSIGSEYTTSHTVANNFYISNVRIVKGTAVYTSAFTPPTSALTAVSGTQLLTLQNRQPVNNHSFIDHSGNNNLLTRTGNASQGSFSPYSPAGWSAYFDGTGDYLSLADNSAFDSLGDFTIEAWVYFTSVTGTRVIVDKGWSNGSYGSYLLTLIGGPVNFYSSSNGSNWDIANGVTVISTPVVNTWYHIAITRLGTSLKTFVNGAVVTNTTTNSNLTTNNASLLAIGADSVGTNPFMGYISNVRIIKGTAAYTSAFTPPTTPLSPTANTSLLMLRSNKFEDDSSFRHAITKNGDTRIMSFSPLISHTIAPNTHSVYFDGTDDNLKLPVSARTALGAIAGTQMTYEFWIFTTNIQAITAFDSAIFSMYAPVATNSRYMIAAYATAAAGPQNIHFRYTTSTSTETSVTSTATLPINAWSHVAITVDATTAASSTIKIFINGQGETFTGQDLSTHTTVPAIDPYIGTGYQLQNLTGYLSNFRIVRGSLVYTSNFTPPTSALTVIANTSLLTCQSNRLIDNSSNSFAITPAGNTIVSEFNPFGENITSGISYSPAIHGGSAYFDGNDYVTVGQGFNTSLGTGNWTVEGWIYLNTSSSTNQYAFWHYGSTVDLIAIYCRSDTGVVYAGIRATNLSETTLTGTTAFAKYGQWVHVALVRESTTSVKLYTNGVLAASVTIGATASFNETTLSALRYGAASNPDQLYTTGYLSDWRFVKGRAVYTGAFTPPISSLPFTADAVHQLEFNSAGIVDVSSRNVFETVGDAKIRTDIKKYGSGAMSFDGTGDAISLLSSDMLTIGTGDFTVEAWINPGSQPGAYGTIVGAAAAGGMVLTLRGAGTSSGIGLNPYGSGDTFNYSYTFTQGTWVHIAVTRSGTSLRIFVNGTQLSSTVTNSTNWGAITRIGAIDSGGSQNFLGHIDDLRITKGFARYTANFTPPAITFLTQ
jgi:hypothetical protein